MASSKPYVPTRQVYLDLQPNGLYIVFAESDSDDQYLWGLCWTLKQGCSHTLYAGFDKVNNKPLYWSSLNHRVEKEDAIIGALQIGQIEPDMFHTMDERLGQLTRDGSIAVDRDESSRNWTMSAIQVLDDEGFIKLSLPSPEFPDPLKALREEGLALADECTGLTGEARSRKVKRSRVALLD